MGVYLQNQSGINRICRHRYREREENGAAGNRMLNGLWAGMLLLGIAYGGFAGTMTEISDGVLEAARESVYLCITMTGVMALWSGLMRIAEESGLTGQMTRAVQPFVNWLFPDIPKGHEAKVHITANIIANVLGLGWAATPSG